MVILGDTCDNEDIAPLCEGADVLVHESTNENAHEEQCKENGHSTPGRFTLISYKRTVGYFLIPHFCLALPKNRFNIVQKIDYKHTKITNTFGSGIP